MTPLNYYYKQVQQELISSDAQQITALHAFDKLYAALLAEHQRRQGLIRVVRKPKLIKGIYLWGGVGIGKTFLMDCFYHQLPFTQKMRMHFHGFMRMIHEELRQHQGLRDPLNHIAKKMAKRYEVICFDEFFVNEITDAMLLGRLLRALYTHGVCIVATSNVAPNDLYKNGLQRSQFLPAIAAIQKHAEVIHIATTVDYRSLHLKKAGVFYTPDDEIAEENMEKSFAILSEGQIISTAPLVINDRLIAVNKAAQDIVWFEFNVICAVPRSQQDYLTIAEKYKTVLISHIPIIAPEHRNTITLFVRLIDVLYDQRIRLICSAESTIDEIYVSGKLAFDFARTRSRLLEMQSEHYFVQ